MPWVLITNRADEGEETKEALRSFLSSEACL
jgi:hypothetical protein